MTAAGRRDPFPRRSFASFILFLDKNISYVFIPMGYAHGRRTDVRRRKPFNI